MSRFHEAPFPTFLGSVRGQDLVLTMHSVAFRDLSVSHIPPRYEADAHEGTQHKANI